MKVSAVTVNRKHRTGRLYLENGDTIDLVKPVPAAVEALLDQEVWLNDESLLFAGRAVGVRRRNGTGDGWEVRLLAWAIEQAVALQKAGVR